MAEIAFTTGQEVTAADMNDLCDQLVTICTSGTRPASPIDGQHIFETDTRRRYWYDSTNAIWIAVPPAATRLRAANQSVATATDKVLDWTTEDNDQPGAWSVGTGVTKIKVPAGYDGLWQFGAGVEWTHSVQGSYRMLWLRLNAGGVYSQVIVPPTSTPGPVYYARQNVIAMADLVAGDYMEVLVRHDAGSSININDVAGGAQFDPFFYGVWLGAS